MDLLPENHVDGRSRDYRNCLSSVKCSRMDQKYQGMVANEGAFDNPYFCVHSRSFKHDNDTVDRAERFLGSARRDRSRFPAGASARSGADW